MKKLKLNKFPLLLALNRSINKLSFGDKNNMDQISLIRSRSLDSQPNAINENCKIKIEENKYESEDFREEFKDKFEDEQLKNRYASRNRMKSNFY